MTSLFGAYGDYYNLFYSDKNYEAEAGYIARKLREHGSGFEVLEFGSGTGKHGALLVAHGFNVTGIERSAEMIAQARPVDGLQIVQGDIRAIDLGREFDAVAALFHVVSYQIDNESVAAVFDRAARHLRPGGVFLFDIWYSPAVYRQRPETRVKTVSKGDVEVTRIAEPTICDQENRIDVKYTIFVHDMARQKFSRFTELHPMRHFTIPEIAAWAQRSGFNQIAAEAFLTGEKPSEESWGVMFVLRKN